MPEIWIVDSIEDGVAALHGAGRVLHLPAELLPPGTTAGDWLRVERSAEGGTVTYQVRIDPESRAAADERVRRRLAELRRADGGGDVSL